MKVVHISYSDTGGAGTAVLRLHRSLLKQGVESRVLVAQKTSSEDSVVVASESSELTYIPSSNRLRRKFMKVMRKVGCCLNLRERFERMQNLIPSDCRVFFTSPLSRYDLSTHPLVLEADIVHLHWVSDFIDYPSFFPTINKPIVWTLHDENLAYGGFHYGRERELYYPFYAEVEDAYCAIKRSSLEKCKSISFVVLSRMMKDFYSSQPFLTGRGFCIIHNGIDPSTFRVLDKSIGRKVFRIPMDNQVIVFCSLFLNDKRKGLKELVDAIEQLNRQDITLLCIGEGRFEGETSVDIRYSGPMTSGDLMAMTYSCGDVFAFPSFQEAFAQTPLEAISCGLPIVAFPCSGMEELVHEQNGVVCDDFTAGALFEGLNKVLSRSYNRQRLHDEISRRFNADTIAGEYCHLYNSLV